MPEILIDYRRRFVDSTVKQIDRLANFQSKSIAVKQNPGPDWRPSFFLLLGLLLLLLALGFYLSLYL